MPMVYVTPATPYAANYVELMAAEIHHELTQAITNVWDDTPVSDVIIDIQRFTGMMFNGKRVGADVRIYLDTNPDQYHEARANALRNALISAWWIIWKEESPNKDFFQKVPTIEVWVRFIPGAWGYSTSPSEIGDLAETIDHHF